MPFTAAAPRLGARKWALALSLVAASLLAFTARASATTFNVTTGAQLTQAIIDANNNPGLDTIQLTGAGEWNLDRPSIISDDLIIQGRPNAQYPVEQNNVQGAFVNPPQSDTFTINPGVNVTFNAFNITGASDALFAVFHNSGNVTFNQVSIVGNGGAGLIQDPGASATFNNGQISDNSSVAIVAGGNLTLNSATVYENAQGGIDASTADSFVLNNTVLGHNIVNCFSTATSTSHSAADDSSCGVQFQNINPNLGASLANGGPTVSKLPAAGSVLINNGDNALCSTVDIRYFVRKTAADPTCDIGSTERGAVRDTAGPTCVVSAVRNGPPKQQDVTTTDTASGLASISNIQITNGTVATPPFSAGLRTGLILTATKTDQAQSTRWTFNATDVAGNTTNCQ